MPDCTGEAVNALIDVEPSADDVVVPARTSIQYQHEVKSSVEHFVPLGPRLVFHVYKFCFEICQCVFDWIGVRLFARYQPIRCLAVQCAHKIAKYHFAYYCVVQNASSIGVSEINDEAEIYP